MSAFRSFACRRAWHRPAQALLLCGVLLLGAAAVQAAESVLSEQPRDAVAQGDAQPEIRWVVLDLPPFFNYSGGQPPRRVSDLGYGGSDGFLRLLIEQLPQYRHEFVEGNTRRYEALSRAGETLCSVLHLSSPSRRAWAFFTPLHPPLKTSQLHLIVHRADAARWGLSPERPVSLASMLKRPGLRPLFAGDRSYGPELDRLLASHPQPLVLSWSTRVQQPLSMLAGRRADYTLEYPALLERQRAASPATEALVAIPLLEVQDEPALMISASCSRTAEGRRRIDDIDAVIHRLASEPPLARRRWLSQSYGQLPPPADLQRFNRFYDERARQGSLVE